MGSMNRIIVATALLLGTGLAAQSYPVATYYDLIRPNGKPRSQAIHQSDLDACYRETGQSRYKADGPAFKKCMLGRGYRFVSQHYAPNPPTYSGPSGADDGWAEDPSAAATNAQPSAAPDINNPASADYQNAHPTTPEPYVASPSPDCPGTLC
jgi:hypothetical protein